MKCTVVPYRPTLQSYPTGPPYRLYSLDNLFLAWEQISLRLGNMRGMEGTDTESI